MTLRFTVDSTGKFVSRRIDHNSAILALTQTQTQAGPLRVHVPADLHGRFDALTARAGTALLHLDPPDADASAHDAEIITEIPIPPELVGVAEEAALRSSRNVNNLIDVWVRALENGLESQFLLPDPLGADARRFHARWFSHGRAFLNFPNKRQWLAVHRAWGNKPLSDSDRAALKAIGYLSHADNIVALNAWFGGILNITVPAPDAPEPALGAIDTSLPDALQLLTEILLFSNMAWPGNSSEEIKHRLEFTGPYLDELHLLSASSRRS